LLSKMMNLAEDWGLRDEHSNPVYRVKRVTEHRRERYLSADEFSRLGKVLDEAERTNRHSAFAIGAVRLLLLTGARLNEILALRWESVDLDQKIIMLPDSKTGPKPIRSSPQAINLLRSMPRRAGNPYVICGRRSGCHLANLQGVWDEVRHAAGLSDVRIHDLRHAFASVASSKGFSLQIIGALLGHKRIETTERYAHLQRDEVATANDAIAERIELMLSGGNR
jgi:integrase